MRAPGLDMGFLSQIVAGPNTDERATEARDPQV
jgi:hypothetical protein